VTIGLQLPGKGLTPPHHQLYKQRRLTLFLVP
jgi:hypothetical protein